MFLSAHKQDTCYCLLAFSKSLNSKTSSSTQFSALVLSLRECSDATMKAMDLNTVRKPMIKIKAKQKAEKYICQDIKFFTILQKKDF